jgi:hypothetical protein
MKISKYLLLKESARFIVIKRIWGRTLLKHHVFLNRNYKRRTRPKIISKLLFFLDGIMLIVYIWLYSIFLMLKEYATILDVIITNYFVSDYFLYIYFFFSNNSRFMYFLNFLFYFDKT